MIPGLSPMMTGAGPVVRAKAGEDFLDLALDGFPGDEQLIGDQLA